MRIYSNREIKEALLREIAARVRFEDVKEWLWEDFGVRVRSWEEASRFMMRDEVTIGDLLAFLREEEIEVDELISRL